MTTWHVIGVVVATGVVTGVVLVQWWLTQLRRHEEAQIAGAIALAGAKPVAGMELADWTVINRRGDEEWERVRGAQDRSRLRVLPGSGGRHSCT